MKKTFKVNFEDWKNVSRSFDLSNCHISMNGETQKVTVKIINNENTGVKTRTTGEDQ